MKKIIDPTALNLQVFNMLNNNEISCICPFHDDHSPSASFNINNGLFYCFSCGTGKNLHQLKVELGGVVLYIESIKKLSRTLIKLKDNSWRKFLGTPLAVDNPYLKSRNVSNKLIKLYEIRLIENIGIGFILKNGRGEITGMQIRQFPGREPRYLFLGERQPIWPVSNISNSLIDETIIITEGVFGALRVMSSGYRSVAVMGAGNIYPAVNILSGRKYRILFDGDLAGYIGAAKFASLGKDSYIVENGFEVDEENKDRVKGIIETYDYTSEPELIAEVSQNPINVYNLSKNFRRGFYENKRIARHTRRK